jgi:thiosulfate/3-mercaptopyruvate sulfurtransferase
MDSLLIDTGTLAVALAEETPPVVLDCRWRMGGPPGRDSYNEGHIPGAVFLDLDTDLAGEAGSGGRHPLPEAADFEAVMRRAGVRPGRLAVVYDDADATIAARAWWLLRYFGHEDVRVLDGGMRAWVAAGRRVAAPCGADTSAAGGGPAVADDEELFTAKPGHLPVLDSDGAAQLARSGVLLDARAAERYRGETEPADPVAGHIPGALSAPTRDNVTAQGLLLSPAELRERYTALGVTGSGDEPAGAYCGSGVTAAHTVLALHLAGLPAALYVGSWSGWITDPDHAIATGPEPG